jgi:putative addiction module component (TIGR02574 family)
MGLRVPIPPPGFDDLSADERLDYVQRLWDEIAADAEQVPVPEWHYQVLEERLDAYLADPDEGQEWPEVRERLRRLLEGRSEK